MQSIESPYFDDYVTNWCFWSFFYDFQVLKTLIEEVKHGEILQVVEEVFIKKVASKLVISKADSFHTHVFLDLKNTLPIVISSLLSQTWEIKLLKLMKGYKNALG